MATQVITDLRALRRAIEGGSTVEKVVWKQGTSPPPQLWKLIQRYRLPYQQVPSEKLPKAAAWAAYLSPIKLFSPEAWLESPAVGIAVALIGITDVRNVGAILRSAAAFGVEWILIKAEGAPLLSAEGLWRASAGALPHLRIVRISRALTFLQALQERGWHLLATIPSQPDALIYTEWNWQLPSVILLGAEDKGLPPEYLRLCERHLTIPHKSCIESLNVSVAAGILLSAAYLTRRASTQSKSSSS